MRNYRSISAAVFAVVLSALVGGLFGRSALATQDRVPEQYKTFTAALNAIENQFGTFMGGLAAPVVWLITTVFLWRETREERAARLSASGAAAVVCPSCGYNLTGLTATRCPECGTQYTLNELLAAQPGRGEEGLKDE